MVDRRRIPRLELRVPIVLFPDDGEPLRTETVDVSNNGFYCLVPRPFAPGARMRFRICLPKQASNGSGRDLSVEGVLRVIRLITRDTTIDFAIGCRIEDYRVVRHDK